MTLLDAQEYDPKKAQKRTRRIVSAITILLIVVGIVWWNRYLPQRLVVGHFFDALQRQDYNTAYGIWMHDPDWQKHPQEHPKYPFNEFYRDWGPGGEWGLIKSHKIYGSANTKGFAGGGVVVEVIVNDRSEHARMFVQKSDKTLTVYPY